MHYYLKSTENRFSNNLLSYFFYYLFISYLICSCNNIGRSYSREKTDNSQHDLQPISGTINNQTSIYGHLEYIFINEIKNNMDDPEGLQKIVESWFPNYHEISDKANSFYYYSIRILILSAQDEDGNTPFNLLAASKNSHIELFIKILKCLYDINKTLGKNPEALKSDINKILNIKNNTNCNFFHIPTRYGLKELFEVFLNHGYTIPACEREIDRYYLSQLF